jgi:hypothetical protein
MRAILLLPLGLAACIPTSTETRFVVNDPSSIALTAGPEDEEVLPAGSSPHEALLDEGRLETSATTAADYRVHAVREEDGRIALRWDTHLALRDGELQRISPENNTIVVPGPAFEKGPPGDALRVQECASLGSSYGVKGVFAGYRSVMREGGDCPRGDGHVPYKLVTPWRNVTEIRQRTTPTAKMFGWVILPTALALIAGGLVAAAPPHASTERRGIGGTLIALGLAIELPFTPSMFAHTREISIAVPRN